MSSSKRLMDTDPLTGVRTYHSYDHDSRVTTIEETQDVTAIIEKNKALHNTDHQKIGIKQEWMHAATIPVVIQMKWLREDGIDIFNPDDMPRILRKLNDPEYRYLKVGSAKL